MHDPRVGRFFAIDPLAGDFPWNSPYAFSENRVIDGLELEGLEVVVLSKDIAGSVVISGGTNGGIVMGPDGVYSFGGYIIGLETDVSINSSISVTAFPKMAHTDFAMGSGFTGGYTFGEGAVISASYGYSGGQHGFGLSGGVGVGLSPIGSLSGYYTFAEKKKLLKTKELKFVKKYVDGILEANNIRIKSLDLMVKVEEKILKKTLSTMRDLKRQHDNVNHLLKKHELNEEQEKIVKQYSKEIDQDFDKMSELHEEAMERLEKFLEEREELIQLNKTLESSKKNIDKQLDEKG